MNSTKLSDGSGEQQSAEQVPEPRRERSDKEILPSSSPLTSSTPTPTPTSSSSSSRLWTSSNPSKRWAETFFLAYSPFWMTWALCIVVPFEIYEVREKWEEGERRKRKSKRRLCFPHLFSSKKKKKKKPPTSTTSTSHLHQRCDEWGYLAMGIAMALPCVLYPLLFPGKADATLPLKDRFWVKATVWISIFSHIGNYFWTHYFYELLGAEYTFRAHRLNGVSKEEGGGRVERERERERERKRERFFRLSSSFLLT